MVREEQAHKIVLGTYTTNLFLSVTLKHYQTFFWDTLQFPKYAGLKIDGSQKKRVPKHGLQI